MNQRALVTITFTSDWLASTGGTGGGDFDDLVQRGPDGLPIVPMSSVKGVLRETAERLEDIEAHGWNKGTVRTLFGGPDTSSADRDSFPGLLIFPGEARIAEAERAQFARNPPAKAELSSRRSSTAIAAQTGTARAHTLRAAETAVPMTLTGIIELDPSRSDDQVPEQWVEKLDAAAAWTLAIGKGKHDGLGRVLLKIEDAPSPGATAQPKTQPSGQQAQVAQPRRLVVGLEQTEKATFSLRSATEGVHDTRLHVPGSALLGWAARDYGQYTNALSVFHTGKVRFGDARPLSAAGEMLWPMPQAIRELKHKQGGVDSGGRLTGQASVRDRRDNPQRNPQRERVKPPLVSASGQTAHPESKFALRTAMKDGRPIEGQLFGYKSLVAAPSKTQRYVAVIEADADILHDDWNLIKTAFDGRELLLGRAKASGQGGIFVSTILDDQSFLPSTPAPQTGRVVVWALSDLALVDEWGEAALSPGPELLGLGTGHLVASQSTISHRRYAPWRGHLWTRGVEHAVIEAGSVLVFEVDRPETSWPDTVGLHRELGLGRIWINPPLLKNLQTISDDLFVTPETAAPVNWPKVGAAAGAAAETPLFDWAHQRANSRRSHNDLLERFSTAWLPALARFYQAEPVELSPSRSQWQDVVTAAQQVSDPGALLARFSEGPNQIAKGDAWQKEVWLPDREQPIALRAWLQEVLADVDIHAARALLKLSADAADDLARKAREGAR